MLNKHATYDEATNVALWGHWLDVRLCKSSTGKEWVLKNIHEDILRNRQSGPV